MKKSSILLCATFICLLFCAWTKNSGHNAYNISTWSIQIGEKEVLSSKKNDIGDTCTIRKKNLPPGEVLHAQRYLCGQNGFNSNTVLTIKNNFGQTIKEYTHKNNSLFFSADAPLKDFVYKFVPGQTISIYFTIHYEKETWNETVLLGAIKVE